MRHVHGWDPGWPYGYDKTRMPCATLWFSIITGSSSEGVLLEQQLGLLRGPLPVADCMGCVTEDYNASRVAAHNLLACGLGCRRHAEPQFVFGVC